MSTANTIRRQRGKNSRMERRAGGDNPHPLEPFAGSRAPAQYGVSHSHTPNTTPTVRRLAVPFEHWSSSFGTPFRGGCGYLVLHKRRLPRTAIGGECIEAISIRGRRKLGTAETREKGDWFLAVEIYLTAPHTNIQITCVQTAVNDMRLPSSVVA